MSHPHLQHLISGAWHRGACICRRVRGETRASLSTHLDRDVLEQRVLQDSLQFAVDFQRQLQRHAGVNDARLEHRGHDATMARQAGLGGGEGQEIDGW